MRSLAVQQSRRRATRAAQNRRRELIRALKDKPCSDCGIRYPYYVMDFDHRPGEFKMFDLSNANVRSITQILAEAAKCDVVCSNCHRLRTFGRKK